jgi:hypothetical protein
VCFLGLSNLIAYIRNHGENNYYSGFVSEIVDFRDLAEFGWLWREALISDQYDLEKHYSVASHARYSNCSMLHTVLRPRWRRLHAEEMISQFCGTGPRLPETRSTVSTVFLTSTNGVVVCASCSRTLRTILLMNACPKQSYYTQRRGRVRDLAGAACSSPANAPILMTRLRPKLNACILPGVANQAPPLKRSSCRVAPVEPARYHLVTNTAGSEDDHRCHRVTSTRAYVRCACCVRGGRGSNVHGFFVCLFSCAETGKHLLRRVIRNVPQRGP